MLIGYLCIIISNIGYIIIYIIVIIVFLLYAISLKARGSIIIYYFFYNHYVNFLSPPFHGAQEHEEK